MFECELCGGMLVFLGQLGMVEHFRCRDCGMMYSVDASSELADDCPPLTCDHEHWHAGEREQAFADN